VIYDSQKKEIAGVAKWIAERISEGTLPHEIGIFVRFSAHCASTICCWEVKSPYRILDDTVETASGHVSISTMHLAKGLEFRAVCVMACDDEIIPLQERIEMASDDADLEEVLTQSDIYFMLPAPAHEIIYWLPAAIRHPNFWMI